MAKNNKSSSGAAQDELVITRVFNAPRKLVFKAFTEPEHLVHWWGPKGFQTHIVKMELRPGGILHYYMLAPDGSRMWGRFEYREIVAPERIVFINSFSDEHGNIVRAPFKAVMPLEILNTWTFTEQDGKTTLTLRGKAHNATEEERRAFEELHSSMQQGFGGTFDQFDEYLARLQ